MKTKTSILVLKTFFILLIAFCLFSCSDQITSNKKVTALNVDDGAVTHQGVQILTIEGFEYVWVKDGYGAGLCHKGNCKYCAERLKQSLK